MSKGMVQVMIVNIIARETKDANPPPGRKFASCFIITVLYRAACLTEKPFVTLNVPRRRKANFGTGTACIFFINLISRFIVTSILNDVLILAYI
jgi:hypothetical protein